MKLAIVGTGYVGLVTGACFSDLGNNVICVDNDNEKVKSLKKGIVTIYEPGLQEMVSRNLSKKRIKFTSNIREAVQKSDVIFVCVGTPSKDDGQADLLGIEKVSKEIAKHIKDYKVIVEKSTVPVETGERIKALVNNFKKSKAKFDIASNPEFLREGQAIEDFMHPDRIVIGTESDRAKKILTELYSPLKTNIVTTDIKGAEIIKHASNSFLATKISFINAVSNICEKVGADVTEVAKGIGFDRRISHSFLNAGIGYGGSCFPKDIDAFLCMSEKLGYSFDLLREVKAINEKQKDVLIGKIEHMLWNLPGKTVGILGLAFKANTDDIRSAPSIDIINRLQLTGCKIKAYDPKAMPKAKKVLNGVTFCKNAYEAARKSDCMVVLTEWNEFKELDFKKIKKNLISPIIVDGRNIYNPKSMKKLGFKYVGMGRKV